MPQAGMSHRGARHRAFHLSYRHWECLCAAVANAALRIARLCRVGMTGPGNWSWPVLRSATEFGQTRESASGRNVSLLLTIRTLLSGCSGPQSTLDPAGPRLRRYISWAWSCMRARGGSHLAGRRADAWPIHAQAGETGRQLLLHLGRRRCSTGAHAHRSRALWDDFGHETRASTGAGQSSSRHHRKPYWWEISYRIDGGAPCPTSTYSPRRAGWGGSGHEGRHP